MISSLSPVRTLSPTRIVQAIASPGHAVTTLATPRANKGGDDSNAPKPDPPSPNGALKQIENDPERLEETVIFCCTYCCPFLLRAVVYYLILAHNPEQGKVNEFSTFDERFVILLLSFSWVVILVGGFEVLYATHIENQSNS